jgi:hypothetical protein
LCAICGQRPYVTPHPPVEHDPHLVYPTSQEISYMVARGGLGLDYVALLPWCRDCGQQAHGPLHPQVGEAVLVYPAWRDDDDLDGPDHADAWRLVVSPKTARGRELRHTWTGLMPTRGMRASILGAWGWEVDGTWTWTEQQNIKNLDKPPLMVGRVVIRRTSPPGKPSSPGVHAESDGPPATPATLSSEADSPRRTLRTERQSG